MKCVPQAHVLKCRLPAGDAILGSSGNLVDLARGSRSVGMGP
jgi:hypothetical protein